MPGRQVDPAAPEATGRDALIARHLPLVRHVARRLRRRLSSAADMDELISAGTLGLVAAATHFDSTRGYQFSTFASPRIRGAMLDELRRLDPATRLQRQRARALELARERVAQRTCAPPTARDLASELGVDIRTLHAWESEVEATRAVPWDASAPPDAPGFPAEPQSTMDVDDRLTRERLLTRVRAAIAELPTRERQALALTYLEGLPLQSVARLLGVTESRVSQLRTQALARLRTRLDKLRDAAA